jgi:Uma2 family endonuclease
MGMPALAQQWTAEMVRALPDDGKRYEVVDGELFVTPAPRLPHQAILLELALRLTPYVRTHRLGMVIISPADVEYGPKTLVQPDLFVAPLVEGRIPQSWEDVRSLLLAVEVLSPSSARADRAVKRRLYQRQGVPEYWIIDVDGRLVERWRPQDERPEMLSERLEWQPSDQFASLPLDLPDLFRQALGEEV